MEAHQRERRPRRGRAEGVQVHDATARTPEKKPAVCCHCSGGLYYVASTPSSPRRLVITQASQSAPVSVGILAFWRTKQDGGSQSMGEGERAASATPSSVAGTHEMPYTTGDSFLANLLKMKYYLRHTCTGQHALSGGDLSYMTASCFQEGGGVGTESRTLG